MVQKPVANALTLELEPVVEANIARHFASEELWYAHDYVPFDRGENFAFLGGRDWDPSQATLPRPITDACEILLLIKDNLAGRHREIGRVGDGARRWRQRARFHWINGHADDDNDAGTWSV